MRKIGQVFKLISVLLTALLLTTGCGVGEGTAPVTTITADQTPLTTAPDVTSPTVSLQSPANGAKGVGVHSSVAGTFSEAMVGGDFTEANFTVNDGVSNILGSVNYWKKIATFNPRAPLKYSTTYTVKISGAVKDLSKNPLGADFSWSFTTMPDTSPPTLTETSPANSLTGVAINRAVTATFSEVMNDVDFTEASFTISDGTVSVPGVVNYTGFTATFSPISGDFSFNTEFTATISGAVTDLTGNALGEDYVWTFTTGANPDSTAPTVLGKSPLDTAVAAPVGSTISATFSEAMMATDFTGATFTVNDGTANIPGTVTYRGSTATFEPSTILLANTTYKATVNGVVTDLAGNPLGINEVWTFTTEDPGALVSALVFADTNLKNCVVNTGKTFAVHVKILNCSGKNITDLSGIGSLTSLTNLNLNNNPLTTGTLPAEIGNLTALSVLELQNTQLTSLPPQLSSLQALNELVLSNNQLPSFPPAVVELTALKRLNLNNNLMVDDLVLDIGSLTALDYLTLNGNQLANLPTEIGSLTALTELYLHSNKLTSLHADIGNLTALHSIGLTGNLLETVPATIGTLTRLTGLDLRGNQITSLPARTIGKLTALITLDLSDNQLSSLPTDIGSLSGLKSIGLDNNLLIDLPIEIGGLTGLVSLDLSVNKLQSIPDGVGSLPNLSTLILNDNDLSLGPPLVFSNLTQVTSLSLKRNLLTSLSTTIQSMTNLTSLELNENVLTSLPIEIGDLIALRTLDVQTNQLVALPIQIGQLSALTGLALSENELTALPKEIGDLANLIFLNLGSNQLTSIPIELGNLSAVTTINLLNNDSIPCTDITDVENILGDVFIKPTPCDP